MSIERAKALWPGRCGRRRAGCYVVVIALGIATFELLQTQWQVQRACASQQQQQQQLHPQSGPLGPKPTGGGGGGTGLRLASTSAVVDIPPLSPADQSMQKYRWTMSPIVMERLRLVYCSIPKNACTMMKRVVLNLEGSSFWDTTDDINRRIHDPATNQIRYMHNYTLEQADRMLRDPQWTRVVIVRDPIQRFASAFLDKCDRQRVNLTTGSPIVNVHCPISDEQKRKDPAAVLDALEAAVRDRGFASLDGHFKPQSHFCDLGRFSSVYSLVDLNRAFVALSELISQLPVPESDRYAGLEALRLVNGKPVLIPHRTKSQELVAVWAEEARRCRIMHQPSCDRSMAARIRNLYKDDYAAFCKQQSDCDQLF